MNSILVRTIVPAEKYIKTNLLNSNETNFLKKQVLARGAYLGLVPGSMIACALDVIFGLGAGIGAVCTLGKHSTTFKTAHFLIGSSTRIAAEPSL